MPVNLSAPRTRPAQSRERWTDARPAVGPEVGFFAVLLVALGALAVLRVSVTSDFVMPLIATLFLVAAAAFGAVAWWSKRQDDRGLTYRDVAGALTLIGICAAAAIDPDQMVRLVQSSSAAE